MNSPDIKDCEKSISKEASSEKFQEKILKSNKIHFYKN